jgi:hypothetical protein
MKHRFLGLATITAVAAVALAGLAACGGDDDSSEPTPSAASPAATTPAGATGTAPNRTTTATATAGGADALRTTTKLEDGATYSVTYDVTFVEDGKTYTGTYVVNQKPPKRSATLTFEEGTVAIIFDGKQSLLCTAEGRDGICLRTNESPDNPDLLPAGSPDQVVKDVTDNVDDARAREVGPRRIAGVEARCWEITRSDGKGTMCFSAANGVLLLNEGTFEGVSSRFAATRISGEVPDSAFEPPYEVIG